MGSIALCRLAISGTAPRWDTSTENSSFVLEAKRRGFTEQQCARLSGWFTEQQIAAVHARPSELVTSSDNSVVNNLAANSSERVCTLALKLRRPIWDDSVDYRLYVSEAKRRGLTEQQCAPLSGRFTEQQIAAAHVQPKPSITDKVQVAEVQRLLIDLGHLTGRADGVVGPRTEAAVKTFERARQLPPTGTVDDKLIVKLKEAQQAKLARAKSDEAKTLAQLREESRKVREETRKGEARITGLKKQAEQLATLRAQKPTKQPVRTDINFGNYHALVIGINRYHNLPRLRTAVADAEAIADVLKSKYGFSVSTLINPTRTQILDRLDNLRAKLNRTDNLLIYYAGHGWLDNKADQGFWLPVDARKNFRSEWVANSSITGTLKAIKAKHVMVVADSCYSGRLIRGVQMAELNDRSSAYLKQMARKKTRVVITSGGLEPVEDGRGEHSPFARAFLNALNRNDAIMDGTNLFNAIREPVMLEARQTPEFSNMRFAGHDGGDFLFVRRK
ncbi:MAG: hypothetical protein CMM10_09325 [Rhodospirillaceae bacterium]|nr:hypothetical protein [Rhodospirillaceae bacterium]